MNAQSKIMAAAMSDLERQVASLSDSDLPLYFSIGGHLLQIQRSGESGIHSGRPKYQVRCMSCDSLIHASTTGPSHHVATHVEDATASAAVARQLETPSTTSALHPEPPSADIPSSACASPPAASDKGALVPRAIALSLVERILGIKPIDDPEDPNFVLARTMLLDCALRWMFALEERGFSANPVMLGEGNGLAVRVDLRKAIPSVVDGIVDTMIPMPGAQFAPGGPREIELVSRPSLMWGFYPHVVIATVPTPIFGGGPNVVRLIRGAIERRTLDGKGWESRPLWEDGSAEEVNDSIVRSVDCGKIEMGERVRVVLACEGRNRADVIVAGKLLEDEPPWLKICGRDERRGLETMLDWAEQTRFPLIGEELAAAVRSGIAELWGSSAFEKKTTSDEIATLRAFHEVVRVCPKSSLPPIVTYGARAARCLAQAIQLQREDRTTPVA